MLKCALLGLVALLAFSGSALALTPAQRAVVLSPVFTPKTVIAKYGSSKVMWLDPSDASTVTIAGSNVSAITNKGALGPSSVSQATPANQPAKATINGYGALSGTNSTILNGASVTWPAASELAFCTVLQAGTLAGSDDVYFGSANTTTAGIDFEAINALYQGAQAGDSLFFANGYGGSGTFSAPYHDGTTPTFISDHKTHVVCGRLNANVSQLYADGVLVTKRQGSLGTMGAFTQGFGFGGESGYLTRGWPGLLGELVIVTSSGMSQADFQALQAYFIRKYG